jgi:hypothetical protein
VVDCLGFGVFLDIERSVFFLAMLSPPDDA